MRLLNRGWSICVRGGTLASLSAALACAAVVVSIAHGQTAGSASQTPAPAGSQASEQAGNAPAAGARTIQMVRASAELSKALDAKKAKQGDEVDAKLQDDVKGGNAQELPRNTVLEGHIDQVQPSESKSNSTLVVTFDKAKLKDGEELPIKATVLAIAEPVSDSQGQQPLNQNGMVPSTSSNPMPETPGRTIAGGQPLQETQPLSATGPSGESAQQNAVPGVTLTSDLHQHMSATFTSNGKNVHLPDGTRMQMAIAVIPPGVHVQ
jgi:hypothetical protein